MQPAPRSDSKSRTPGRAAHAAVRTQLALGAVISLSLLGIAASCNKETPPAAEEPLAPAARVADAPKGNDAVGPATAPATDAKAAAAPAGVSRVSEGAFELAIAAPGPYEAGKASEVSIVLDAKEPYHVNDKYPYKFKLKPAENLSYAADVVGKDRAKLEKMRVTLPVAFTPQKAGRHLLSGQFSFSVCTDEKCLIEKRELSLDVDVK